MTIYFLHQLNSVQINILWGLKFVETVVKIDDDGLEGNQKLGLVVSKGHL